MARLFKYLEPYFAILIASIILLFGQAACDLALPDLMANIVNKGISNGDVAYIAKTGMQMLLISLLSAAFVIIVGYLAAKIAAGVSQNLRSDLFKKIEGFSNAEFDKFSTSSLITRTTNDITQILTLIVMMVRIVFYAPIMGIGGVIRAWEKSPSMSWTIGIAVITLVGLIAIVFAIAMPKFKAIQKLIDRLNLVVRENLDGMLVIRAFNTEKFEEKRFDVANNDLTQTNLFVNRVMSGMMPAIMFIMNITTVLIVWVGAKQISAFQIQVGDMMAYMQYAMQVIMSFLMLSMMFIMIPRASVSAERIADVLETESSIKDPENPVADVISKGVIEFVDVNFGYPSAEENVLHNISFTAKPSQTTAFIGSTGSGKTTLVNLLPRFYDVTGGKITIDGVDIREMTLHTLRSKLGYVPQRGILFSGTISSNLSYANKDATQEDMERAADIAQATDFIEAKTERFETSVAQGGTNVSGGQKQRLAIARALLKSPPIYIFDDSFSALDFKTDAALRKALKEETGHSTVLLVSQRISTILSADQIIVLDKGFIVGKGTHNELMSSCEVYREIAYSQLSKEELE